MNELYDAAVDHMQGNLSAKTFREVLKRNIDSLSDEHLEAIASGIEAVEFFNSPEGEKLLERRQD